MARQARRTNPGDAANIFVRVILSDVGTLLGGFTEEEWERTVEYFGGRCAYTGADLAGGQVDRDHAIPLNRAHCGVHLFGNVLPATKAANSKKGRKHYREFVEDEGVLEKIESFLASSRYEERVSVFGDLRNYCEAQYRAINALCLINKNYLKSLLPPDEETDAVSLPPVRAISARQARDVLPIALDPANESAFKEALLRTKQAWLVVTYQDGRREVSRWKASRMTAASHVTGNIRSRPQFRAGAWQRLKIVSVLAAIERPKGD